MSEEIPADIMRAVEEALGDIAKMDLGWVNDDRLIIARAIFAERRRCARLARITHPKDADFASVWGEYEHGCDDTQGAIYEAILKGEPG